MTLLALEAVACVLPAGAVGLATALVAAQVVSLLALLALIRTFDAAHREVDAARDAIEGSLDG